MGVAQTNNTLCKVVYFDEESVTDYIQIVAGGKLEKTTELLNETTIDGEAGVKTKAGIGVGGVLKALIGFEASATADASAGTSFSTEQMAKNIVKNTVLTDFIDILEESDSEKKDKRAKSKTGIQKFKGFAISAPKDSLSYMALISPYLSMLKGGSGIPAGEFNLAIEKLDNTIKSAKGYYEFVGTKGKQTVIFRFNIKSFKNNYKVTDLLKMDISIYAIRVGKSSIDKLNFSNELDVPFVDEKDNPTYQRREFSEPQSNFDSQKPLDVFDVLLAGVESDD